VTGVVGDEALPPHNLSRETNRRGHRK
jgi:hypothetical protein